MSEGAVAGGIAVACLASFELRLGDAHAFISQACALQPEGLHPRIESIDHLPRRASFSTFRVHFAVVRSVGVSDGPNDVNLVLNPAKRSKDEPMEDV